MRPLCGPGGVRGGRGRGRRLVIYGGERRCWSNWLTTKERINAIFDVLCGGGGVAPRNSWAHLLSIRSCPATGQPIFLILNVKKKNVQTSHGLIYLFPSTLFPWRTSVVAAATTTTTGRRATRSNRKKTPTFRHKSLARVRWLEIYNRAIIYTHISVQKRCWRCLRRYYADSRLGPIELSKWAMAVSRKIRIRERKERKKSKNDQWRAEGIFWSRFWGAAVVVFRVLYDRQTTTTET